MDEKQKKSYFFEYFYMLCITALIGILPFLYYKLTWGPMVFFLVFVVSGIIIVWKNKLSRLLLYYNNLILIIAAICISYFVVSRFKGTSDSILGILIGVAVADVFSFTKKGRFTPNAKLMNNTNALARLTICLPVTNKPGLQPIIGVGDLTYYSIISLYSISSYGLEIGLFVYGILLLGQVVNIVFIELLKNKIWFTGFPATLFPGLFAVIAYLIYQL